MLRRLAGHRPWAEIAGRLHLSVSEVQAKADDLSREERRSRGEIGSIMGQTAAGPRPRIREECRNGLRPCPWIGCKFHLLPEAAPRFLRVPRRKLLTLEAQRLLRFLMRMEATCVVDLVEERGSMTLEEIGAIFLITRERVRQIEARGREKYERACRRLGVKQLLDL